MTKPAWLAKMRCPECRRGPLKATPARAGQDTGRWKVGGLSCPHCRRRYPVTQGVLRMLPSGVETRYQYWAELHKAIDYSGVTRLFRTRFEYPAPFLLTYHRMAALGRKSGLKGLTALELGAGSGSYSLSLVHFGVVKESWLLDISLESLLGARQVFRDFGLQPFLIQADIHRLPFADGAFDLTLSGGLMEHFVGPEQQALVDENCRVSRRIFCQVPSSTPTYWVYRKLLTWWWGKWPFGFEVPLKTARLKALYAGAGAVPDAWEYSNLASALLFVGGARFPLLRCWKWRPGVLKAFKMDDILLAKMPVPGK